MAPATSSTGKVLQFPATSVQAHYYALPAGDAGVKRAVSWMGKLAAGKDGALSPQVRQFALQIVHGLPARDDYSQASAVFNWVKQNIEFRGEADETLQSPIVTLNFGAGDCDDHGTLVAALLGSLGIRARFQTVATDPTAPQTFTHVYTQAWMRQQKQWLALDTTVGESYPGWAPRGITRIATWNTMPGLKTLGDSNRAPAPVPTAVQIAQALSPIASDVIREVRNKPGIGVQYGSQQAFLDINGLTARDLIVGGSIALGLYALFSDRRRA